MKPTHIEIETLYSGTYLIPKTAIQLNAEKDQYYLILDKTALRISKETYEKVRHELLKEI